MRSLKFTGFVLMALICNTFSCTKQQIRKKFTGDFSFTTQTHFQDVNGNTSDGTSFHNGTITISEVKPEGATRKQIYLEIKYRPANYVRPQVYEDGSFESRTFLHGAFEGGFRSDGNELDFIYSEGGLGYSYTYTVHGVRR